MHHDGQGEQHMAQRDDHAADEHECAAAAKAVVDGAEERGEHDGAVGKDGGDPSGSRLLNAVFVDQQVGGEFQEGAQAGVEHHAEEGDEPEAGIAQDVHEVAQGEVVVAAVIILWGCCRVELSACMAGIRLAEGGRLVKVPVHEDIEDEQDESQQQQCRSHKDWRGDAVGVGDDGTEADGGGGAHPCHGHLNAHGRGQLMAGEPFGDYFRHRDACDVASHAEDAEAQGCHEHLCLHVAWDKSEEGEGHVRSSHGTDKMHGIVVDGCPRQHHASGKQAGEADATFVEDDAAPEEHQQEDVEDAVAAGIEAILCCRPAHAPLLRGCLERGGQRRDDVPEDIAHHHHRGGDEQYGPAAEAGAFIGCWVLQVRGLSFCLPP